MVTVAAASPRDRSRALATARAGGALKRSGSPRISNAFDDGTSRALRVSVGTGHRTVASLVVAVLAVIALVGCGSTDGDVVGAAVEDYTGKTEADPNAPSGAKPATPLSGEVTTAPEPSPPDPTTDGGAGASSPEAGAPWTCTGSYGTTKASSGDYYVTAFGCWKDAAGVSHGDAADNCVPTCLAQAKAAGLCLPGDTGKNCEERVTWFTADAARFGCLARLKITNPANGKSVIAVALDFGPSCTSVEAKVKKEVLDASGRVDRLLFGSDQGVLDRSLVHVTEVAASTPLGPTP